ncbi:MAG: SUMF1/EgtB/PvdO family nonheme iron enzyme, partial [Proteobacteria bacterium]|nr:SUMF1/EgtB/PvdO family nonheme iron enzyme [Pseudomonadota bacterium]
MVRTASLFIGTLLLGARVAAAEPPALDLIAVPGGEFVMGEAQGEPDEAPKTVRVAAFRLMRHEVTNRQFAAFVAAVALMLLIWPSLRISTVALIIVAVASGGIAAVSFIWRYFVRYNEEYATRLQELIALQDLERVAREERALAQTRNTLEEGFSGIRSAEGLEALDRLTNEFEQVQAVLGRWSGASLVSIGQIPTLAQETYRQGLSLLTNVLEMSLAVHESGQSELETRLAALELEIQALEVDGLQAERLDIRRKRLASYKDQLQLGSRHELQSEELLLRVNL